ncbi:MAG: GNAT family N-acetyltransferase [Gemmatimonadota bacterium]
MKFEFRPLREADLPLLLEWLDRPHLRETWGPERTLDDVREKYLPRIIAGEDAAQPYVASLDGEPVGYIQCYRAGSVPGWYPDEPGPGVWGIDQFLADGDRLDQGLGTAMVSQFVERLFRDQAVAEVRLDPHPENHRAIRCYEKAGFVPAGRIVTPDGPALLMRIERDDGSSNRSPNQHPKCCITEAHP